jgi:peptide-methionine (S)-S-oxide reductase
MFSFGPRRLVTPDEALPGHEQRLFEVPDRHAVLGTPLEPPFPADLEVVFLGMGCFWGAERKFWQTPGVYSTAVGYQGGYTDNPTYDEVCTGRTGHTEAIQVVFDPEQIPFAVILKVFWENHDPTQGFRQGNDVGTQYRSAIYTTNVVQDEIVEASRAMYQRALTANGYRDITTEIDPVSKAGTFYFAEGYHQQYLHKVPNGYCGMGGTGVSCPAGVLRPLPEGD